MPKIQWSNLPAGLKDHLFERLRERRITVEDLYQLKLWRETEPVAPEGPWFNPYEISRNECVVDIVSGRLVRKP